MITIERKRILFIAAGILIAIAAAWAGYTIIHANTPVRIGILLPLTGDVEFRQPLEWAKDTINSQGGVGGRKVELVYKDTGSGDVTALAQELLSDDSVRIIVGPENSDDVYALAPAFIAKKKIMISPTATSGDIIRAFGKKGYVWRTSQGDAAQVKVILTIMKDKGAKKVVLLATNNTYGKTFYDWFGFFATEYGIDTPIIRQFDSGSPLLEAEVNEALKTDPDYLVAACWPEDASTIKRVIDRSGSRTQLFLTDSSAQPALIEKLGAAAEGIEGTNPAADPTTGFVEAYEQKFGHRPADFAAPAYDALLIAAFSEARQDRVPFESLADSVYQVVQGEATVTGWNETGVRTALTDIRTGAMPWITGASGGLEYDVVLGVDPVITWYSHWAVHNGTFVTIRTISSENLTAGSKSDQESAGGTRASEALMAVSSRSSSYAATGERTDFRAVIVGPSRGWANYRHQADVLSIYTLLRKNGVPDDHIILMTFDDVPYTPENPLKGNIHNTPGGQNVRAGAEVDYYGTNVTAEALRNILTGIKTGSTPIVLESNASTDVFVYIASHGSPGKVVFANGDGMFTTEDFRSVTDSLARDHRYREMVFFVDTCFGESVATGADAPGIYYLTGAAKNEPSLGAVYDMNIKQWLSDEFTSSVVSTLQAKPDITFRELYPATYKSVTGSHVRLVDTGQFSLDTPVMTYLSP